jgi:hypothetical protein
MKKSNPCIFSAVLFFTLSLAVAAAGGGLLPAGERPPGEVFSAASVLVPAEYPHQPEVNDPPKFEDVDVDFTVTEGNLPGIDTDEPRTCSRTPVKVTFLVKDPDGDKVKIMVDLDEDGKFDDFRKVTKSGKKVVMKKKFDLIGDVTVKYRACDVKGLCTAVLKFKIGMVLCPPKLVEFMTGTKRLEVNDRIIMTLRASDAQNDKVRYEIDWDDDGAFEEITPYYPVKKRVTVKHVFKKSGSHVVSARACDENDGCSEIERRTVVIKSYEEE